VPHGVISHVKIFLHIVIKLLEHNSYCGAFTPRKICNLEICSRDYATVDEAVFLRAEVCHAVTSRASPRIASTSSLVGDTVNTWMTQEWGGVT
jgi:hypothetical protein